jgi:hypothetical protein
MMVMLRHLQQPEQARHDMARALLMQMRALLMQMMVDDLPA